MAAAAGWMGTPVVVVVLVDEVEGDDEYSRLRGGEG